MGSMRDARHAGALAALKKAGQQPGEFLMRHVNRNWGDLSDEDRKENDYSLATSCGLSRSPTAL